MSTSNEPLPDLSRLGFDLEKSFAPAWAKETTPTDPRREEKFQRFAEHEEPREFHKNRPAKRGGDFRKKSGSGPGEKRDFRGKPGSRNDRSDHRHQSSQPREHREPPAGLTGWKVRFLPEEKAIPAVAKQIRSSLRAYALFDVARLFLGAPDRYSVELVRDGGPCLWLCPMDSTLWSAREGAITHALELGKERFYRQESVEIEGPKGNFPVIARCGFTGALLGPPNHHDYQTTLREHHRTKLSNVSYDRFHSRIEMVRDEALIAEWKAQRSSVLQWIPLSSGDNAEAEAIRDFSKLKQHFLENHSESAVQEVMERVTLPGAAAQSGDPVLAQFLRNEWQNLQRFPLPLANTIGRRLGETGMQIFKTRENITYVGSARPKYLDREQNPVSAGVAAILDCLLGSRQTARTEQWKALLSVGKAANETSPPGGEETAARPWFLADLMWLLQEGYVVDYHGKNLVVTPRPEKKPQNPVAPVAE